MGKSSLVPSEGHGASRGAPPGRRIKYPWKGEADRTAGRFQPPQKGFVFNSLLSAIR